MLLFSRMYALFEAAPVGGFKQYHLAIYANNGGANVSGDELELYTEAGGSNQGDEVDVPWASDFLASNEVTKLFDGVIGGTTNGWTNDGGTEAWVRFRLNAGSDIRLFDWRARLNEQTNAPRDMAIFGRNESFNPWTHIVTFSNQTGWSSEENRRLNADTGGYVPSKYRLDIQANGGDGYISCSGIDLYATIGGPDISPDVIAATAASSYLGVGPLGCFANPVVTAWSNNGGTSSWIEFELGTAVWLREWAWTGPGAGYVTRNPKEFTMSYWDGAAWVKFKTYSDQISWSASERRKFTLAPVHGYTLPLVNPRADVGSTAGWTVSGGFSTVTSPSYDGRSFYGGAGTAFSRAYQEVSIPEIAYEDIDTGTAEITIEWVASSYDGSDDGWFEFEYYDAGSSEIGTKGVGPEYAPPAGSWTALIYSTVVPALTRTVRISMNARRDSGNNNNAYFDALRLVVGLPVLLAPELVTIPAIHGSTNQGNLLTVIPGVWSYSGTLTYQWKLEGVDIGGAIQSTYTIIAQDADGTITVEETNTNDAGEASATSDGLVVSPAVDAYWDNVSLLLGGNGVDGTNTFIDDSEYKHGVSVTGAMQHDDGTKKFGNASIQSTGTGDYATINHSESLDFGAGDFTVEFWYRRTAEPSGIGVMISKYNAQSGLRQWIVGYDNGANRIYGYVSTTGGNYFLVSYDFDTDGITLGNFFNDDFHHVAFVRNGATVTMYVDGDPGALTYNIGSNTLFSNASVPLRLAARTTASGVEQVHQSHRIDEIRITKGVARYTGAFTPSLTEWTRMPPDPWLKAQEISVYTIIGAPQTVVSAQRVEVYTILGAPQTAVSARELSIYAIVEV